MTTADAPAQSAQQPLPGLGIAPEALEAATEVALAALPHEAGGILVGWHEGNSIVVTGMLPVPDKKAGRRHYVRHQRRAQAVLTAHREASDDDRTGYVGEWHSHPAPQPPSRIDYKAIADIAAQTDHPVALVVLAVQPDSAVTAIAATARRTGCCDVTIAHVPVESRTLD